MSCFCCCLRAAFRFRATGAARVAFSYSKTLLQHFNTAVFQTLYLGQYKGITSKNDKQTSVITLVFRMQYRNIQSTRIIAYSSCFFIRNRCGNIECILFLHIRLAGEIAEVSAVEVLVGGAGLLLRRFFCCFSWRRRGLDKQTDTDYGLPF